MRSQMSRGVTEWFGGEDLYMGSSYSVIGRGSGGPPGGSTCPGGPYGLNMEGNQPLGGLGAKPP